MPAVHVTERRVSLLLSAAWPAAKDAQAKEVTSCDPLGKARDANAA